MTDKKTLALIVQRGKGRCEICGKYTWEEYDPHHRLLRSRGGGDEASNLLHICHICHLRIHAEPKWASENGFMVASWQNPEDITFLSWLGWVKLHDDGTQERITKLSEY